MKASEPSEVFAPFRSFPSPWKFLPPPKSHRLHCFQKSIASPSDPADKRQTVGKWRYNAIDTFSAEKRKTPHCNLASDLSLSWLPGRVWYNNLGSQQRGQHVVFLFTCVYVGVYSGSGFVPWLQRDLCPPAFAFINLPCKFVYIAAPISWQDGSIPDTHSVYPVCWVNKRYIFTPA